MTTVYIVYSRVDYEGSNVESVHLTREGAQKFVNAYDPQWCDGLCIEECTVQP
jgi:hypothetical protein